jgi:hypothetical protein
LPSAHSVWSLRRRRLIEDNQIDHLFSRAPCLISQRLEINTWIGSHQKAVKAQPARHIRMSDRSIDPSATACGAAVLPDAIKRSRRDANKVSHRRRRRFP